MSILNRYEDVATVVQINRPLGQVSEIWDGKMSVFHTNTVVNSMSQTKQAE